MSSHGDAVSTNSEPPKAAVGKATCIIRPLQDSDLAEVVEIHVRAIPYSINSVLGRSHLADVYRALIRAGDTVGLVAVDDAGRIVGVVTGVCDFRKIFQSVVRVGLLVKLLLRLLAHPEAFLAMVRVLLFSAPRHPPEVHATLASIAVTDVIRGKGVGTQLVLALEKAFNSRGIHTYWLEARAANPIAQNFYKKLGFTEFARGRCDICFVKRIP